MERQQLEVQPRTTFQGLRVMQLMAENLSRRSQPSNTGVWPRGAKVRRTEGVKEKPDSSRKTTWA